MSRNIKKNPSSTFEALTEQRVNGKPSQTRSQPA
jgi:hypothetical protein